MIARHELYWILSILFWKELLNYWSQTISPYSRWGRIKDLQGVTKDGLGKKFLSFRIGPIVLFALLIFVFRCSSKLSWLSKIKPRRSWKAVCLTFVLLKVSGVWRAFLILRGKIYFWCLFSWVRVETHFPLSGPVINLLRVFIKITRGGI